MWRLWDSLAGFEVSGNPPVPAGHALRLEGATLLTREAAASASFDLSLDVAFPGEAGFAGLAFGARDPRWHELIYLSPSGEVQYDPVMNGSNTWQVYPELRGAARTAEPGGWMRLRLHVRPEGVAALVDGKTALVVRPLRGGGTAGRVGVWAHLPSDVRNLELTPGTAPLPPSPPPAALPPGTVMRWRLPSGAWVPVERNGVLNLNRHLHFVEGGEAEVRAEVVAPEAGRAVLSLGYSDRVDLLLNGQTVFAGVHRWDPPRADGRILPLAVEVPVRLNAGVNELRARIAAEEAYGWGLAVSVRRPAPAPAS